VTVSLVRAVDELRSMFLRKVSATNSMNHWIFMLLPRRSTPCRANASRPIVHLLYRGAIRTSNGLISNLYALQGIGSTVDNELAS
jgi:hypothetical protein